MPCGLGSDMRCLSREVEREARVKALLCRLAGGEKFLASSIERPVKGCEELEGAVGEDLRDGLALGFRVNLDAVDHDWEER